MKTSITIALAGQSLELELNFPENTLFFREFLSGEKAKDKLTVSMDDVIKAHERYPAETDLAYAECGELAFRIADWLAERQCCIFHGAAFLWKGKAWILTAPSGTGKTTQYFLWKIRFGEEVTLINGDKPILECREDSIRVHSSPWKGKEGMHNRISAPLGGILYLRQAEENSMELLPPKEAILPLLYQFLMDWAEKDTVLAACDILDRMLKNVPVWLLSNRGDDESAMLAYRTIECYEEAKS